MKRIPIGALCFASAAFELLAVVSVGAIFKRLLLVALLVFASSAFAQEPAPSPSPVPAGDFDLGTYLTDHAYFSGGPLVTGGKKHAIYEVRLVDDFKIAEKVRGVARVSLFTLQRQGEAAPTKVPTTLEEAAAYSDGEVWIGAYRPFTPNIAVECVGGLTFKMTSLAGTVGDPLDGTKLAGGCGPRLSFEGNHVSILLGHYGPIADSEGKLLGFAPQVFVTAYIPLAFLGENTAFTPDFGFGKGEGDARVKSTLRLLMSTRF